MADHPFEKNQKLIKDAAALTDTPEDFGAALDDLVDAAMRHESVALRERMACRAKVVAMCNALRQENEYLKAEVDDLQNDPIECLDCKDLQSKGEAAFNFDPLHALDLYLCANGHAPIEYSGQAWDQCPLCWHMESLHIAESERDQLRGFALGIFEVSDWPVCDIIDDFDFHDQAEKWGLLRKETRTGPCGENCWCEAYDGEFPLTCYVRTELLTGEREGE